jgi:hypothetical protein
MGKAIRHSHSMQSGGFEVMSYTTRPVPRTSLMMRRATPRKLWEKFPIVVKHAAR